ncbi:MAG: NAD(+)/NADH kinase [Bryobacteraceae bacterium]|nr:NAD(+)/NADH kinase [Bryobacteraceae bacterium]MDW8380098.1 NAD(+)/NADH kinase [Bryobacterales bacterium]
MSIIDTVGIISKPAAAQAVTLVPELLAWLRKRGISIRCDNETAAYGNGVSAMPRELVPQGAQLLIVLGGDGTLLSAARAIGGRDIPIFAVNLGGLGFLTAITVDSIFPELERALKGQHRIGRRRMLWCEVRRRDRRVADYEALNDAVISKAHLARMVNLEAYVDGHLMCAYKADGLIVSTPTGSTAYSLSAGGPIIFPTVEALAITPICPHMLTNRPVILPDTSIIEIVCNDPDDAAFLTIDGQVGEPLKKGDRVCCRRSENSISLIRPPSQLYFDVLRAKLKWGER